MAAPPGLHMWPPHVSQAPDSTTHLPSDSRPSFPLAQVHDLPLPLAFGVNQDSSRTSQSSAPANASSATNNSTHNPNSANPVRHHSLPSDDSQSPTDDSEDAGQDHHDDDDEDDDDDDDDDDDEDGDGEGLRDREDASAPEDPWRAIKEDESEPCEDELIFIESRGEEPDAADHAYWERLTFFDLDDPDIVPGESGRIDWLIDHFNGTRESPNKDLLMYSPTVRIGGYDWRIKFFPRGDDTEFLSCYLECTTIQSDDFAEYDDFDHPPLPFLDNIASAKHQPPRHRRSIAAQISIVMYNPNEPRVNEHKADAHQFHKSSADYGWRYFSRHARPSFHYRQHGQRRAILRGDQLAFSAYIRLVADPTGCMWQHGPDVESPRNTILTTSLRPFRNQYPQFAAVILLFHFAPFRDLLRRCKDSTRQVHSLQELLLRAYSRQTSHTSSRPVDLPPDDAVRTLQRLVRNLRRECDPDIVTDLIGSLDPDRGAAVGPKRLSTSQHDSIQAAVNAHPLPLETPALLTLELERQRFNKTERRWDKLTGHVVLNETITVGRQSYVLFAFVTLVGDLRSNRHNVFVRPGGKASCWYAYEDGTVTAMTNTQAMAPRCGLDSRAQGARRDSPFTGLPDSHHEDEVAYAVSYVRADVADVAFALPRAESWDPPEPIKQGRPWSTPVEDLVPPAPTEDNHSPWGLALQAIQDGSSTPPRPIMDGDDVIMSDDDDDHHHHRPSPNDMTTSVVLAQVAAEAPNTSSPMLWTTTSDGLGQGYYHGQMRGSERHGQGRWINLNGDEYAGSFRHDQPDGNGTMIYASTGDVYEGEWRAGQRHGHGRLTERATHNVYDGGWKDDRRHGRFTLAGVVTDEDRGGCTICYERAINTAFYDCGHVMACHECAALLDTCPVCRKRIVAKLQLYGVKMMLE